MIEGIDISSVNGAVDFAALKQAGITFVYIKATEGDGYTNPRFAESVAGAKAAGLLWGAYHFYRHDVDPNMQAGHFLAILGTVPKADLLPMVDVEAPGDGAGPIAYGKAEVTRRVGVVLDAIHKGTGITPGIYTYPAAWLSVTGNTNAFAWCPLWLASYNPQPPALLPGSWPKITIWQYTSTGHLPGVALVDCDRFDGSVDDLLALSGSTQNGQDTPLEFPQTGHTVRGGFKALWQQYGLTICGYPLTEEAVEADGYTRQYFENVRFAWKEGEAARIDALGRDYLALKGGKP